jgi:hypothetical protein
MGKEVSIKTDGKIEIESWNYMNGEKKEEVMFGQIDMLTKVSTGDLGRATARHLVLTSFVKLANLGPLQVLCGEAPGFLLPKYNQLISMR